MTINNMNPFQLLQLIRSAKNPEQFMLNMLDERSGGNPLMANLMALAKRGDEKGVEDIARNICKESGVDFDKEFIKFKKSLGL